MKSQFWGFVLILNIFAIRSFAQVPCLTNAENLLNAHSYKDAIYYANQCIDDFGTQALGIQHKLDRLNIAVPIGQINSVEKNRIFYNGLLNDVATACFYKGEAALRLYNENKINNASYKKIAIEAYKLTLRYDKGRHWDPSGGFFWSPAEAARNQLEVLEK
jgi:hypothetical protein